MPDKARQQDEAKVAGKKTADKKGEENGQVPFLDEAALNARTRRRFLKVWTLIGIALICAAVIYLVGVLSLSVGIIVWTVVFVFCLRTPVNWMERRGVNRVLATALSYLLMFVVLTALGALLFSPAFGVGEQFRNLAQSIPSYVEALSGWYNEMYERYQHFFQDDVLRSWLDQWTGALAGWASDTARTSAEGLVNIGGVVANSAIALGFALVVAFWTLIELPRLGKETKRLLGEKHREDAEMLHLTFTRVMGGYIKATLLQSLLIGVCCGIVYAVVGLPNFAALGGIAGVLNIIPVVGPWVGGLVAAVVGMFTGPWVALIVLVATVVIQQFIYTFVSPKLMADSVDVHPALVFIALTAGSALGGAMGGLLGSLLGMLASIPSVAAVKALFVYYFEKKTGRRIVDEEGVFFKGKPTGDFGRKSTDDDKGKSTGDPEWKCAGGKPKASPQDREDPQSRDPQGSKDPCSREDSQSTEDSQSREEEQK